MLLSKSGVGLPALLQDFELPPVACENEVQIQETLSPGQMHVGEKEER